MNVRGYVAFDEILKMETRNRQGDLTGLKWGSLSLKNKGFEWMDEMMMIDCVG